MARKAAKRKHPRLTRGTTRSRTTKDARGTVRVRVFLTSGLNNAVKGNRTKSATVRKAKVTQVFAAIERALFG